ncbi:short-chain dehydrogenase [Actinoplanes sp. SE50]|uniref:SDR family NAD(P)-dependent oxidoreductase n=1 Tax=unclassified Actinoplanes TaxID=2626549 RepID=UPI00023EC5BD|nr:MULTISPECIES: SDR family NAD(P)-dependent oxidoreductase [unclassified Actinoplanes]AEV83078.1 3-oxoacyl-[acyl-carrier-protein] reductase [Actinoplanes sp. SE50/110]ATO81474.1 short-chain dehydrogenase [Actinoplanes sp. SE50]SLL98881.1 short-chain dehydrogenase/reductase [Actinoplanes sp. SE50/110]
MIWFITGASRGFGREWAAAALRRGDRVAGTARQPCDLAGLAEEFPETFLPLRLDVTDRPAAVEAVRRAAAHFGGLDVVVNNAGYGHFGMVEELAEEEIRAQLETNVLGLLWVTQAALPILRVRGGGHIIQVSSIGGLVAFPGLGAYSASKFAVEGLTQSLAQEVAAQGIRVTLVEPSGFRTDWAGRSARHSAESPEYDLVRAARDRRPTARRVGDPRASAAALLAVVDDPRPPLRVFFGSAPLDIVTREYEDRLETWQAWQHLAVAAES